MFGRLFREAQSSIDTALTQFVTKVLVSIPFGVAAVFSTIVLRRWLIVQYGADTADLALASGFAILGLIGVLSVNSGRSRERASSNEPKAEEAGTPSPSLAPASEQPFSETDRELLLAALTTAMPVALPTIVRNLLKNLPLVIVLASAAFVATRSGAEPNGASDGLQPAE